MAAANFLYLVRVRITLTLTLTLTLTRYAVASANFLYLFASADDVTPPVKPPLHALCTEDLGFAAQE